VTDGKRYRLEPRDIRGGYGAGPASPFAGKDPGEQVSLRNFGVWLEHAGTGIHVEGKIPDGDYTVRQVQLLEVELRKSLFAELELKVARKLGFQK